jgi:CSLREA domain-containing protein
MTPLPKRLLYPVFLVVFSVLLSACSGSPSLTVNSANDADDGVCDTTHCSLREAINKANTLAGPVTIKFNIGGGGVQTIQPASALPPITVPVKIDGTTQPGFGSTPLIELDGSLAPGVFVDGLVIQGGKSTLKALAINRFSGNGIRLNAPGENRVVGCFIGTDVTGTAARPNHVEGIYISGEKNVIGGAAAGERNVISGNTKDGIWIDGIKASVIGNYIGTDITGSIALGNTQAGIVDDAGLAIIGGGAGEGNLISGNGQSGVLLGAGDSFVQGNRIGTDAAGNLGLGNNWGVSIAGDHNTIGGDTAGKRNIISANRKEGVTGDPLADNNLIPGNYIGTDISGTIGLGNGTHGVLLAGNNNVVGGKLHVTGNVISANLGDGVVIQGMHNDVTGNLIGLDAGGSAALGNHGRGVVIQHDLNLVGGEAAGMGNVISDNWQDGVRIEAGAVLVKGNTIGTDATGTVGLGNHKNGIFVSGVGSIQIGGSDPLMMNVISANQVFGVWIEGGSDDVTLLGNRIGTNAAGTAALGNVKGGVRVDGTHHQIGMPLDGAGNLISGNGGPGIAVLSTAAGIVIKNNFIGTNAAGMGALGNGMGIEVGLGAGATSVTIGGAVIAPDEGNLISGNLQEGLLLFQGASVWGNKIGTDATGLGPLGNGGNGILIKGSGNQIGGVNSGNTIAFNGKNGVAVFSESHTATRNAIQVNHIHDNLLLGIAIDEQAVLENDPLDTDPGDNNRQNHPDLMTAFADLGAGTLTLVGKFSSKANIDYSIEVFANPACDPSGHGEGYMMIAHFMLTTNADGYAVINKLLANTPSISWGDFFTATATDPDGNTSDFSNCAGRTEVPAGAKAETQTAAGMTFKPLVDPLEIFYGKCDPNAVQIAVDIGDPPKEIGYVLLFVRLVEKASGEKTAWGGGLTMIPAGNNRYSYNLSAFDVPDFNKFADAWLQYQFVAYDAAQNKLGASDVFGNVSFKRCGRAPGATE